MEENSEGGGGIVETLTRSLGAPIINDSVDRVMDRELTEKMTEWLQSLWNCNPALHRLDVVSSMLSLPKSVSDIPVRPRAWSSIPPLFVKVTKEYSNESTAMSSALSRAPTEHEKVIESSDYYYPTQKNTKYERDNEGTCGVSNLLKEGKQEPLIIEDGVKKCVHITFLPNSIMGLTFGNSKDEQDAYGRANGPLVVTGATGQAYSLGLQEGDIIFEYNGKKIRRGMRHSEFRRKMMKHLKSSADFGSDLGPSGGIVRTILTWYS